MELVDNSLLRAAVSAFAADSVQLTYLEVMRNLLQGELLLDSTGSDLRVSGSTIEAGSTISFSGGAGPDGGSALFAYTRHQEVGRMHPPATHLQTIAQPAAAVLELAASQGYGWLYLDPAGPTCAISLPEADLILRNPRNDAVKAAVPLGRAAVLEALAQGGILFYAVDERPDGIQVRTSAGPDGAPVRLAFTSPAEVAVRAPGDAFTAIDVRRIVDDALTQPFVGLVINPAGPWVALRAHELSELRSQLS